LARPSSAHGIRIAPYLASTRKTRQIIFNRQEETKAMKRGGILIGTFVLAFAMSLFVAGCGGGDSATATPSAASTSVTVTDTAGAPVEGATVFAIPVADVEALSAVAISRDTANFGNYSVEGLAVDEPLEDLVKGNFTPTGGGVATYKSAVTDAGGKAELTGLPTGATDKFFIYVNPGPSARRQPLPGAGDRRFLGRQEYPRHGVHQALRRRNLHRNQHLPALPCR
jgi:hypothetical protein